MTSSQGTGPTSLFHDPFATSNEARQQEVRTQERVRPARNPFTTSGKDARTFCAASTARDR